MFPELAFVVVGFAAIAALNSWRAGLVLCTVIAILQDPMRKLTPGQPVYFVVLVGAVFGAAWLGAYGSRVPLRPGFVVGWREQVGGPFSLLVFVIVGQAIHSLTRFGSVPMTAIGLLSYLSPIPAVVFAYQYALRSGLSAVTRWMLTYVALASIALASVYVEYLGVDWPGLGQVGEGLIIYDVGRALKAYAGFFRAAEVAAWHTACVSCFAVILMFGKRRSLMGLILALGLTVFLASIGALTGRRKLLVQVAVFLSVYGGLFLLYQRHARKLAGVVAVAGLACYFAIVAGVDPDPGERVYDSHKLTVGED